MRKTLLGFVCAIAGALIGGGIWALIALSNNNGTIPYKAWEFIGFWCFIGFIVGAGLFWAFTAESQPDPD